MFQGEQYAIHSTFINLPFVIKIFVLYIYDYINYEWPFYTGFTVKISSMLRVKTTQ